MNTFSISQLEQFSGIKAHTIRIWEQRYKALNPSRSEGNTRYYDDTQLRRLLNITSLMSADYKVSKLCSMSDKQLFDLLSKESKKNLSLDETAEYFISQLIASAMLFDEPYFEKIFSNALLRFGMKETYSKIIYPTLVRIGLMWSNDTMPASQEHFISNLIKQKMFSAIDALPPPKIKSSSWLLFLPENEFHEIGLLFSHYMIRKAGNKVVYLGGNVPIETLDNTVKLVAPSNILFFLVHYNSVKDTQSFVKLVQKKCAKATVFLSGNEKLISQLKLDKSVKWIKSVKDLENEIE